MKSSQRKILIRYNDLMRNIREFRENEMNPEDGLVIWRCSRCDVECAGENVNGMCATCNRTLLNKKPARSSYETDR